ncbi:MAG: HDOD domain-containing protein [Proteobacteria bacterium]|nr:HDOD domain-containing protein [Pseudomonadota bacterium]MBU4010092.1 HDOD domain-containing protein [Pseudomonadota bacterium]MBU4036888.1 HDOD domain-containing protein [Pseudomonadota bacterium]
MDLEKIIKNIDSLSPVSSTGTKIMEIISNPDSSLGEIVEVIQYDQSMTANLLKICNSSFFALREKVVSVRQAVSYLGMNNIANIVIMGNFSKNFNTSQDGYGLNEGELWKYSVSSAVIAQGLAEKRNVKNIPRLFTSALLKDIGKVVLSNYVQDAFKEIELKVQEDGMTFLQAEREVLGIDHAELGAMVAEKWNFNPEMVFVIRNHHNPINILIQDNPSIPIIYLADSICMMIGIGGGSDGLAYKYYQEVVDRLNFTEVELQKTIADFWEKTKAVEEMVTLSGGR